MLLREAAPKEKSYLYTLGYQEWPKKRTLEQYIKDNQKEESYGTRYVLANEQNQITASLMMLSLNDGLFGIGSVVVPLEFRGQGFGKKLLKSCMALMEQTRPNAAFMLYSEIDPGYYEKLGFQVLPDHCQRYSEGICMVKANRCRYQAILKQTIPDYF